MAFGGKELIRVRDRTNIRVLFSSNIRVLNDIEEFRHFVKEDKFQGLVAFLLDYYLSFLFIFYWFAVSLLVY